MLTDEDIEKLKAVFATKEDLNRFATKADLISMENRFDKKFATKDDLNRFSTKSDLDLVVKDLVVFIGEVHDKLDAKIENIDKKFTKQLNGIERDIRVLNKEAQILSAYKIMTDHHELRLRSVETDLGIV